MEELTHSQMFSAVHKELYHHVVQYGQACLLGDKTNAINLLASIKENFEELKELTRQIERLEHTEFNTQEILAYVGSDEDDKIDTH